MMRYRTRISPNTTLTILVGAAAAAAEYSDAA